MAGSTGCCGPAPQARTADSPRSPGCPARSPSASAQSSRPDSLHPVQLHLELADLLVQPRRTFVVPVALIRLLEPSSVQVTNSPHPRAQFSGSTILQQGRPRRGAAASPDARVGPQRGMLGAVHPSRSRGGPRRRRLGRLQCDRPESGRRGHKRSVRLRLRDRPLERWDLGAVRHGSRPRRRGDAGYGGRADRLRAPHPRRELLLVGRWGARPQRRPSRLLLAPRSRPRCGPHQSRHRERPSDRRALAIPRAIAAR